MSSQEQNQRPEEEKEEALFIPGDGRNTYMAPPVNEGEEAPVEGSKWKQLWDRYSYTALKLYLTQFAIGLFGAAMAMATAKTQGALFYTCGVFSILFYAMLVYTLVWNVGARDRISVDAGARKRNLFVSIGIALAANIPNYVIAILFSIGAPFMETETWAGSMCAILKVVALFTEGMYWWILSTVSVGGKLILNYGLTYFLITLPSILFVFLSYCLGHSSLRFTGFGAMVEKSHEENMAIKQAKEARKQNKK